MAKIKVAIYDTDKLYQERFTDYLMNYKAKEMELSVFSGISFLLDALRADKYQLIILGGGYEEILPKLRSVEVPVLILTESSGCLVCESVGMQDKNVSFTSRYQSMDEITHQMYLLTKSEALPAQAAQNAEVIGVFSPVHHELQMTFSFLYAKNLAQKARVLYINLIDFSGFSEIFGEKEYDLADLILDMQRSGNSSDFWGIPVYEYEGLSYICPPKNPEDLKLISGENLKAIIQAATEYHGYEVVVIDMGMVVEDFTKLLAMYRKLYCICKRSAIYAVQQREFYVYLRNAMGDAYMERVEELELPQFRKSAMLGRSLLEQLNWSEFGDYVRSRIGGNLFVGG